MNKTAIKNFAVWARQKLIADITYKAGTIGITEHGIAEKLPQSTNDLYFFDIGTKDYAEVSGYEIKQRNAFIDAIRKKEQGTSTFKEAFDNVVEEVAYTWFNRLIAIRFMEVNEYLPSGVRVLSSENKAKLEPDFVTTPFDTDLEFTPYEQDRVIQLKDENKLDELFRMLFIKQCNKLNEILPELFEKTDDYTELLLNISFTDKDGIVYRLTHDIDEDDFNVEKEGQVEIIGWFFQYYNTEIKMEIDRVQGVKKINKSQVPAATQIFTPDWIVRYMVENSLGRLWYEEHNDSDIKNNWKYYISESNQESEINLKKEDIRDEHKAIKPEDIKLFDPCMGSGHILVYAFDVLMQIYESYGYTQRDAASLIVENNIYGLDVDKRATQLAYFAVMMKGRKYDRRFLYRNLTPHIYDVPDLEKVHPDTINAFGDCASIARRVCDSFIDGKEYGSLITPSVSLKEIEKLNNKLEEMRSDVTNIFSQIAINTVAPIMDIAKMLVHKYDVVVTNPPYIGSRLLNDSIRSFMAETYPEAKTDMYATFILKCVEFSKNTGYTGMMTPNTWLTINSYAKLRDYIISQNLISSMILLSSSAFNDAGVVINSFVLKKETTQGLFCDLRAFNENELSTNFDIYKSSNTSKRNTSLFLKLPNAIIDPSFSEKMINVISDNNNVHSIMKSDGQTKTGDNNKYLRMIWEVGKNTIGSNGERWCLHAKGGAYRKWYGNVDTVIDWSIEARNFYRKDRVARITPEYLWYKEGITWSLISGKHNSFRLLPSSYTFNCAAPTVFFDSKDDEYYVLGLLNTNFAQYLLMKYNDTVNLTIDDIGSIPYSVEQGIQQLVVEKVKDCIGISKLDWDSFETSWDFRKHPLVPTVSEWNEQLNSQFSEVRKEKFSLLEWHYEKWKSECNYRFNQLKENEEELDRIFIDIYGLQDELTPDVEDKDVTVYRIFDTKDDIPESMGNSKYSLTKKDVVKSLISYAVGCMFGRYSLDVDGLAYAGGQWDESKYSTFIPDADNCIPITDEEYFEDDIVGLFCAWIKKAYGEDNLEENLDFIAKSLGNKGNTSREIIRNYFLNDFIKDHIKTYQKRPIYWQFDSGKQNGFKSLCYMHRWNADTIGNMRVEYLHRMQRVYDKEIERMQEIIDNSRDNKEINKATKRKEKLQKQVKETKDYDAKVAHLALTRIDIDLDDGVKVNYEKVQTGKDGSKMQILAKI